ncbi:MAG: peptidoglycan-binding protein [Candidatus Izemoplasmatales bacterium]|nr:peptidoglycan-binding protein [Candidatus Izemoplasmatales bacterium]
MKKKLSLIVRKVFLGSLASIASSNPNFAANSIAQENSFEYESKERFITKKNVDLIPKLILKQSTNDEWSFMAHRSHRSHQSHQSHRSHYSSSQGTTTEPKTNQGIQPVEKPTSNVAIRLGTRILKKDMSGTDVTELINILLKKEYLKLENGGTSVTGIHTYDEIVEDAIKKFQKDNGLTNNGICDTTTVYYLKNK